MERREIVEQRSREDQEYDATLRAKKLVDREEREKAKWERIEVGDLVIEHHQDDHRYRATVDGLTMIVRVVQQIKGSQIEPYSAGSPYANTAPWDQPARPFYATGEEVLADTTFVVGLNKQRATLDFEDEGTWRKFISWAHLTVGTVKIVSVMRAMRNLWMEEQLGESWQGQARQVFQVIDGITDRTSIISQLLKMGALLEKLNQRVQARRLQLDDPDDKQFAKVWQWLPRAIDFDSGVNFDSFEIEQLKRLATKWRKLMPLEEG